MLRIGTIWIRHTMEDGFIFSFLRGLQTATKSANQYIDRTGPIRLRSLAFSRFGMLTLSIYHISSMNWSRM
ncbi:hypothetical protein CDO73_19325 [Saccharibacillus sp. O23]|nr:hypothetical protein CDO73_19325 [Saccharibacillus sp. O23]